MTHAKQADFTHRAETALPGLDLAALCAVMRAEAQEHGLKVTESAEGGLVMHTDYGNYLLTPGAPAPFVAVETPRADWLFALKEGLTEKVAALTPETAQKMRWSDALPEGSRPPNFQFATLHDVAPVGRDFLRITLDVEHAATFDQDAIHFRLILPPAGDTSPEWPHIAANGATVWPKGDKGLHRPVYTVRALDLARNRLTFDLFVHAGGRATVWAQAAAPGARIGLTGPGGGGLCARDRVALYADETGFPAVARILEALPDAATGQAVLSARGGAGCGYDMPNHPGVTLVWTDGDTATDLADRAIAERATHAAHALWFAAEKAGAQKLRGWCRANDVNLSDDYVAAFWTQGASQ